MRQQFSHFFFVNPSSFRIFRINRFEDSLGSLKQEESEGFAFRLVFKAIFADLVSSICSQFFNKLKNRNAGFFHNFPFRGYQSIFTIFYMALW